MNYKIIFRGVQFRIVYIAFEECTRLTLYIDIFSWQLRFMNLCIQQIPFHLKAGALLVKLVVGFCLANIDELFKSHNNVSSNSGFVRGLASKKHARVSNESM